MSVKIHPKTQFSKRPQKPQGQTQNLVRRIEKWWKKSAVLPHFIISVIPIARYETFHYSENIKLVLSKMMQDPWRRIHPISINVLTAIESHIEKMDMTSIKCKIHGIKLIGFIFLTSSSNNFHVCYKGTNETHFLIWLPRRNLSLLDAWNTVICGSVHEKKEITPTEPFLR